MNCPHHIMIYKSKPRSYRDLPVRLAEFGTVYRYEKSGELSGMTRVRGFTQDDAHIFCTEEQVADEFRGCIEMTQYVLDSLGLTNYRVRLGLRDPDSSKYVGAADRGKGRSGAGRSLQVGRYRCGTGTGRSRLLRSQGRFRGQRLHRPRVAVGYGPAGLQPARAVRTGVRRSRQQAASARDDSSRSAGLDGAVHRRRDRAFWRRFPAVAVSGADSAADRQRESPKTTAGRSRPS